MECPICPPSPFHPLPPSISRLSVGRRRSRRGSKVGRDRAVAGVRGRSGRSLEGADQQRGVGEQQPKRRHHGSHGGGGGGPRRGREDALESRWERERTRESARGDSLAFFGEGLLGAVFCACLFGCT